LAVYIFYHPYPMFIKTTIFTATLLASTVLFAGTIELSLIDSSVSKHPDVVEKANEIALKALSIDQILAEEGLHINLSTQSKLPILFNVDDSRLSEVDDTYINSVVTLQKNLYDFGVFDHKMNAEKNRKKALELEYLQIFETTLQKLLNTVNDVARLQALRHNYKQTISTASSTVEQIKLRFTSGIGTIMEVRRAQLQVLDLETEMETVQRQLTLKRLTLRDEFGIVVNQLNSLQAIIQNFVATLELEQQDISDVLVNTELSYQRSVRLITLEKLALFNQIDALEASGLPQLVGTLTGVVYDVITGYEGYEIYGSVNVSLPLYDSGLSASKKRSLSHQIKMQDDLMLALRQNKSLALQKLTKQYRERQSEKNSADKKETNLSERLAQIKQRLAVVDDGLLTKLQTQLQLAQTERILLVHPYHLNSLNINYWTLSEQLLEKMNLNPAR